MVVYTTDGYPITLFILATDIICVFFNLTFLLFLLFVFLLRCWVSNVCVESMLLVHIVFIYIWLFCW